MNDKEWGTPVSRDKIIYRRNKLIEYQKIGELRFTPLYETIDENILDINYMIYEIDKLQSNWNSLREWLEKVVKMTANIDEKMTCKNVLDKMNELEGVDNENNGIKH